MTKYVEAIGMEKVPLRAEALKDSVLNLPLNGTVFSHCLRSWYSCQQQ